MPSAWSVVEVLDRSARVEVDALLATIERETGDEALSEEAMDRLSTGPTRHALRRDGAALTGYGIASAGPRVQAEPALGTYDDGFAKLFERDGTDVELLLRTAGDQAVERLVARWWVVARRVDRLRRALPGPTSPATALEVRAFVPGRDEAAWVEQNNAAFAGHPTQGAMTVERVVAREGATWFDPSGFLLFFEDGRLAASCWTKVHRGATRDVGEIYVISVAPFAQGRGLGRIAVLRGLEHLAALGITLAELYVEEENLGAYRLYESLGFAYDDRVVELHYAAERTT